MYCSVAAPRDLAQTMMRGRTAQGRVRTDIKLLRWRDGWEPVNAPRLPVATAFTEFALREADHSLCPERGGGEGTASDGADLRGNRLKCARPRSPASCARAGTACA